MGHHKGIMPRAPKWLAAALLVCLCVCVCSAEAVGWVNVSEGIKSNQISFFHIAPFIHVQMQPKVLYIRRKENETNPLNIPTPRTLSHVTHTRTHTPLSTQHTKPIRTPPPPQDKMEYGWALIDKWGNTILWKPSPPRAVQAHDYRGCHHRDHPDPDR